MLKTKSKFLKTIFSHSSFFILLLCTIMNGCESENPGEPSANLPPDTYISEASAGNTTIISFYGTDKDGFVDKFAYQWQGEFSWTETGEQTVTFKDLYSDEKEIKIFYVKGIDNDGLEDPTPAEVALTPTNALPETEIISGPAFGSRTGEDVVFNFSGEDADHDGVIIKFEYTMDDLDHWQETPLDLPQVVYLGLSTGAHVFYVRAVDNLGGKDPSPAQVAFLVEGGKNTPDVEIQSTIPEGFVWFSGLQLDFSWQASVSGYYGIFPENPFSYAIDDSINFDKNPTTPLSSGWTKVNSLIYVPTAGDHTFYLKVRDTAGGIFLGSISFSATTPEIIGRGVLVINGVSPQTYGSAISDRILAGAYWGNVEVDFWDIFGDMYSPHYILTLPAAVDYIGGGVSIPATVLKQYSTIVWLGNRYEGDFDAWYPDLMLEYLNIGGNLILASRYSAIFLPQKLTNYLNIGWREYGRTLMECKSVFPGLVDMDFDGSPSYSDIFSASGFLDSQDDNTVTAWDNVSGYTKTDLTTTLLFAHRSVNYDTLYPFGYVRGLGVWSHPNFSFSSTASGDEFPAPGTEEAQGNFILFSARNYRFDITATRSNFEFILRNMCGEQ